MCTELQEALSSANYNLQTIANKIQVLKVLCEYKGAFMKMIDVRGFRDSAETYEQMQIIGDAKSDICISLLTGKGSGLIVSYLFATQLGNEKERALVLEELELNNKTINEKNSLLAILTIKNRA